MLGRRRFQYGHVLEQPGTTVGMVTGISSDTFGQQLLADLKASKIETGFVVHSDHCDIDRYHENITPHSG